LNTLLLQVVAVEAAVEVAAVVLVAIAHLSQAQHLAVVLLLSRH
jgi:hypothetical protein